jgi:hypothetical protein
MIPWGLKTGRKLCASARCTSRASWSALSLAKEGGEAPRTAELAMERSDGCERHLELQPATRTEDREVASRAI